MNVVLFGATGMIGAGVLIECLDDPQVESVLAIGRSSSGVEDSKLTEVIHQDFFDYSGLQLRLEILLPRSFIGWDGGGEIPSPHL